MTKKSEIQIKGDQLTMTNVKKKQNLRNNEYYNLQETFDELYAKSNRNYIFTKLMELITSRENIQLAYRN